MGRTHILADIALSQNNTTLTLTAKSNSYSCACGCHASRNDRRRGRTRLAVRAPDGALLGGRACHWRRAQGIRQRTQLRLMSTAVEVAARGSQCHAASAASFAPTNRLSDRDRGRGRWCCCRRRPSAAKALVVKVTAAALACPPRPVPWPGGCNFWRADC